MCAVRRRGHRQRNHASAAKLRQRQPTRVGRGAGQKVAILMGEGVRVGGRHRQQRDQAIVQLQHTTPAEVALGIGAERLTGRISHWRSAGKLPSQQPVDQGTN